ATRNSSARFAAVRHSRVPSEPDGELKFTSVVTLEVAARFFGPSPPELELQRSPARDVVPDAQSPAHIRPPGFQVMEVGVALVEVCPFGPPGKESGLAYSCSAPRPRSPRRSRHKGRRSTFRRRARPRRSLITPRCARAGSLPYPRSRGTAGAARRSGSACRDERPC